tara:strand:- start:163 stop:444 length:282 start_codon:yes stop_codon:yes gene_type:complete
MTPIHLTSEALTVEQIIQLRKLIHSDINKNNRQKASMTTYHNTKSGQEAVKRAQKKYYQKQKKLKVQAGFEEQIALKLKEIAELKEQLKQIDE